MDEATLTLQPSPDISFSDYKETLIERFSNTKIRDQLPRLCLNSSAKLSKWALGNLRDKLDQGNTLTIDDPMADVLTEKARTGGADPTPLLGLTEIFGDLPQSKPFTETVARYLQQLSDQGTQKVLTELLSKRDA